MLKSVVLCIILWHEMCEFSSRAHPGSTDSRVLKYPAWVSPKINDTDVQTEARVIYNVNNYFNIYYNNYFNHSQIFHMNSSLIGTTATTTAPTTAPTTNLRPGYVVTNGIGAHKVHTEQRTWAEARQICIGEGGELAVIKSHEEELIVQRLSIETNAATIKSNSFPLWIGFHYPSGRGEWISVFSETLAENGWAHWWDNRVDNNGCMSYYTQTSGNSWIQGMYPIDCNHKEYFICKITTI